MIKTIVQDIDDLAKKCIKGTDEKENLQIITDLVDTCHANSNTCVGLAANQIGYNKRIIVVKIKNQFISFINPVIIPLKTHGMKKWSEGCLSFPDRNPVQIRRFKKIKVKYSMLNGDEKMDAFTGFEAAIFQHEINHLDGKLI